MKKDMMKHIAKHIDLLEVDIEKGIIKNRRENIGSSGYKRISLKDKTIYSHQIIAYKLHGERCWGCEVNHINGNKMDNRAVNLEVIFHRENMLHAFDSGIAKSGDKHPESTISNTDVMEMHRLFNEKGLSGYKIGKLFGKHGQTVMNIVKGRSRRQQYKQYHGIEQNT